ncbi:MAG: tetratricopeptide repeat protein [Chitinophagaceae bacterium]
MRIITPMAGICSSAYPDIALKFAQEGLELAQRLQFQRGEAECLLTKGTILEQSGHYPQALEVLQRSLQIGESIANASLVARNKRVMGKLYASQGDYQKALDYLQQAKHIQVRLQDEGRLSTTLKVIGETYLELEQSDSAWAYLKRSYELTGKNDVALDDLLKDLGQVQAKLGNDAQAMTFFRNSIPYSLADKDRSILNETYLGIAGLFKKSAQTDSCIFYARKALEAAQEINYSKGIVAASKLLSEVYEAIDERQALQYFKMAMAVRDSVFNSEKAKQTQRLEFMEKERRESIEDARREYTNKVRLYALLSAMGLFLLLAIIFYRNNRIKQRANEVLNRQKQEIDHQRSKAENALEELRSTQAQLVQREKMASLGELTAGIAHEIQNPLNFVNNFSEVSGELMGELKEELQTGNKAEAMAIAADIEQNLEKITHHGKRADAIVKGMLQHSRTSTGRKELTDINALADEYLRLSYHGLRAKDKSFNADFKTDYDASVTKIEVIPQDLGRVLLNVFNNAFYAVNEKKKQLDGAFEPIVSVSTKRSDDKVEIRVRDNGTGISRQVLVALH